MDSQALVALVVALLLIILLIGMGVAALVVQGKEKTIAAPAQRQAAPRPARQRGAANRMAAGVRRRRQAAERQAAEEDQGSDGQASDADEAAVPQQRAAPQQGVHKSRQQAYDDKRRKKDEEREAQAALEEAAAAEEEARRQAEADAEAAQWMGMISTEGEGTQAEAEAETQGLLQAFVDHIKERNTVVLEELAAHFGLRVQDVINRVQELESEGRITGVMDDRGKFIYISREEMEAVADFIRRRGRIAIGELAAKSNQFIDLEEKAMDEAVLDGLDSDLDSLEHSPAISVGA